MIDTEVVMENSNAIKIAQLETEVKFLREKVEKSEDEIRELKGAVIVYQTSTVQVKNKLDQILTAVVGDEMGNVGMVKRLANVEAVVEWINLKKSWALGIVAALSALVSVIVWAMDKILP